MFGLSVLNVSYPVTSVGVCVVLSVPIQCAYVSIKALMNAVHLTYNMGLDEEESRSAPPHMLANAQVPKSVAAGPGWYFRNEGICRHRLDKIVVPGNITFGVELETFFPSTVNEDMLSSTLASGGGTGWR